MSRRWFCIMLLLGWLPIQAAEPAGAAKPAIRLGYVEGWADSVVTTQVAAQIIRGRLGHPVELMPVAAGIMWQGVARGDLDATLSAWLPVTQGAYYRQFKDKVLDLGPNYVDARIGLVVPDYVAARAIGDLNAERAAYQGRIVGIDAGAGVMQKTEAAIKAYRLNLTLMPSSGPGMTAELARAINARKPIVVTGWVPHWMFAKWKLRFLDDPQKVFGEAEHVNNVAHPGLSAKAPAVLAFLRRFRWRPEEIGPLMLAVETGAKPAAAAASWIRAHPERVAEWAP
ncbi:glycine betaine ABC transporter substrate-binding protein [Chromobacterium haemolyticum]|uniref:glycine betaine ABC transporter substrate-binding protein n=1 Tax=Chromobacterium haemolyticum TaxID=394935 RepID=UPI0009D99E69|nr:glycine betaine ABC transporter substrate-binding protein [Chromobacterium haemolyticum]OQS37761.1 glycine/betaine ABC transporter substrate-binding protein [Chromobacterium haemolyticum]